MQPLQRQKVSVIDPNTNNINAMEQIIIYPVPHEKSNRKGKQIMLIMCSRADSSSPVAVIHFSTHF